MYIKRNFVYRYFLVNRTENICDVTAGKNMPPIMSLLFEPLKKYSNFIKKCPYPAGNISMVDCPLSSIERPPPYLPAGDFRSDVRIFNDHNVTVIAYRAFVTIEANGIDPLLMG